MITFLYILAFIGFVWLGLCALPAGMEARMPMPYLIALTPFLWVPLVIFAGIGAWQHEWGVVSLLLVAALMTSSQRISYWGTGIKPQSTRDTSRETGRETPHTPTAKDTKQAGNSQKSNDSAAPALTEISQSTSSSMASPLPPETRETDRETLPPQFAVMTLNCRYGRADADDILANVRTRGIDVLALQEVSDDLIARLDAAGVARLLPYRQSGEPKGSDNGGYNVIFSRYEPAAAVTNVVAIPAADVPAITLRLAGEDGGAHTASQCGGNESDDSNDGNGSGTYGKAAGNDTDVSNTDGGAASIPGVASTANGTAGHAPERTVTFCSAHPKSPMRGCADWSAGILGLRAIAGANVIGDRNIAVVMGDLNSSTDHPSFRALLKGGFKDASLTQGTGPHLTFPSWLRWPRIELDHVLFTRGLKPSGVESFVVKDTDHLALVATLSLR